MRQVTAVSDTGPKIIIPEAYAELLQDEYDIIGYHSGRDGGKSHSVARSSLILGAQQEERIVIGRETLKSLEQSMFLLLRDLINEWDWNGTVYDVRRGHQHFGAIRGIKNATTFSFVGLSTLSVEQIKSLESTTLFILEEGQYISQYSLDIVLPTLFRGGRRKRMWAIWNPEEAEDAVDNFFRGPEAHADIPAEYKLKTLCKQTSWRDNPFHSDQAEGLRLRHKASNPMYGWIWEGMYRPNIAGSIWTKQTLRSHRITGEQAEKFVKDNLEIVVVAVDPAVKNKPKSDEHGIIVCGVGKDGRGYVLEDASLKGRPDEWGRRTLAMYDKWKADLVVAETNQGGDMVTQNIRILRPGMPVVEKTAIRHVGVTGAPVAAAYAEGRISHVGTFPELEAQMVQITDSGWAGDPERSPDRVSALVHGMRHLLPYIVADAAARQESQDYEEEWDYAGAGSSTGWMG